MSRVADTVDLWDVGLRIGMTLLLVFFVRTAAVLRILTKQMPVGSDFLTPYAVAAGLVVSIEKESRFVGFVGRKVSVCVARTSFLFLWAGSGR